MGISGLLLHLMRLLLKASDKLLSTVSHFTSLLKYALHHKCNGYFLKSFPASLSALSSSANASFTCASHVDLAHFQNNFLMSMPLCDLLQFACMCLAQFLCSTSGNTLAMTFERPYINRMKVM
ncbi:unnamed protein product [Cuscuta epithymum]|uniref:Secreted protein n=1 Tax=Cuscuta epithymum TaxID=186058 RepID=A0AAV0EGC7_9ASTE|nr:unnamed protein product [Cuscuta epithymum]